MPYGADIDGQVVRGHQGSQELRSLHHPPVQVRQEVQGQGVREQTSANPF